MDEFWKKYSDGFFFTKRNAIFFFSFLGFISVCTINNQHFYNKALDDVQQCLIEVDSDKKLTKEQKRNWCLSALTQTFW